MANPIKRRHAVSTPVPVSRGAGALRRVLREQTCDLRELDEPGFRRWLDQQLARWRRDPVFAQRVRIRDVRRAHPALQTVEQEHRRRAAEDAASPHFSELARVERELTSASRAIAGLTGALKRVTPERRPEMRHKLKAFREKQHVLQRENADLLRSSPERQALLQIEDELQRLRSAYGLDREENRLSRLLKEQGRRGGRAGQFFERSAVALTEREILPDLLRRSSSARRVYVLRGVTLGAASLEFDQLIVRTRRRHGRPVEVLAVVEVKRNINDLAHGFRQRQENLAWLTGETASYKPEERRTKRFRSGHFDVEAVHVHDGESLVFDRQSFRLFRRDPESGHFLERLYFITRSGRVWGLSGAAMGRIAHRVALDEKWAPDSEAYLRRLRRWCQSLAEPCETPDVLRWYAGRARRGRQILLAGGATRHRVSGSE
jgi:hypothetical protein